MTVQVPSYLSRIPLHVIGRSAARAGRLVDDPEKFHRAVMALFENVPSNTFRSDAHILFRVDPAQANRPAVVLIRSDVAPAYPIAGLETIVEVMPPDRGTPVAFRATVNAVRRKTVPRDPKSLAKTREVVSPVPRDDDPDAQGDTISVWLTARLSGAIRDLELFNHVRNVVGKKTNRTIQTDLIDGFAFVEDAVALQQLLKDGVGRAKSYGCGLLTVKAI